jgi:hypothetical protein
MRKTLFRAGAALTLAASFGLSSLPAYADGSIGDAMSSAVNQANIGIKNAMNAQSAKPAAPAQTTTTVTQSSDGSTVAQVPPIKQSPVGASLGLPVGFGYTADISAAWPEGNIGLTGHNWLPGGFDAVAGYGFSPKTRLVASIYQLQHYPVGFNTGQVPVYLSGFANPIGCANLDNTTANCAGTAVPGSPSNINVATKDTIDLFQLQQLFFIGGMPGGRKLPIVISPTYVARFSKIAASNGNTDIVPFAIDPPDGPIYFNTHTRTAQVDSLAFTVPFLKTPKMFGTFTAAPSWLVHLSGANIQNHAQIYQILYLEYTPTKRLTFFLEPQSSRDYLPTDQYAQHLIAYFFGGSYKLSPASFFQIVMNSGGPTNESPYGVTSILCPNLTAVASGNCATSIGGLKSTQIQFQYGIGTPNVIPF